MSRSTWVRFIFLVGLLCCCAPPAQGGSPATQAEDVRGAWLVRMRDGLARERSEQILWDAGLAPIREIPRLGVWVVESSGSDKPPRALSALRERGEVLWHEPNEAYALMAVHPDDDFYWARQWNLRTVGFPDAWMFSRGDAHPIAIIDSGIDLTHPDLSNKIWRNMGEVVGNGLDDDGNGYVDDFRGWNFVDGNNNPQDGLSHGSHVAGIAGAETDNAIGVAGASWFSPVMALKVCRTGTYCPWSAIAEAVIYATDNGARIINLSLGGESWSQTLYEAVQYASSRGSLLVAAAGNGGSSVYYPAAFPQVMAVGATNSDDLPASFSNPGPEVEVAAPGVNIYSCNNTGGYYRNDGTSMASPHVAGLAALLWASDPSVTAAEIRQLIISTAKDVHTPGRDNYTGWGRIDAASAFFTFLDPHIALSTTTPSIPVREGSAALMAQVTDADGHPVLDGLTVSFTATLGNVEPPTAITAGGIVATLFTPTTYGTAIVTASLASYASDSIAITVRPLRKVLPILMRP